MTDSHPANPHPGDPLQTDTEARAYAVAPGRTVIVQAPAGSGKTTLLVERYLGLLGVVEAPEEILAITFTRTAAAEMKQRILRYLEPGFATDAPHEQSALEKARAVSGKVLEWGLLENPQRLLIRTIDSFNHYLARTMPVASALGPVPAPADNTRALYRRAARQVLAQMDGNDTLANDLNLLLDWRDHRSQDIENLLATMLGKRDQWLRAFSVTGTPQRAQLEAVLHTLVHRLLDRSARLLVPALHATGCREEELLELLRFAARTLTEAGTPSAICAWLDAQTLPGAAPADLPLWQGLAQILLVNDKPQFRRAVDKRTGFPPGVEEKIRFTTLLKSLADDDGLALALHQARQLPEPNYSDEEWLVLESLVRVLQRTASELELVFASTGKTDFAGLAAAALRGLGDEESGITDLGLYLDRKIQHILVDEFQDTNWSQMHLLEKLTAGWDASSGSKPGSMAADGRSLFLVGDPMQSIYRFREAEVGLFIRTRDQGIGALIPESLRLTRNFRSRAEIVEWVNGRLGPIFPTREDISAGAVAYAPSEPGRKAGGGVDLLAYPSEVGEADAIARLLAAAIAEHQDEPDFKAAIIVRARSHLRYILPALQRHAVPYRAVKLDPLTSRPVVQDLLAMTRALLQPADTAAILALLRAPMCGLTLADLHALSGDGRSLHDEDAIDRLSAAARSRAESVFAVLRDARQYWRRRSVRELVEGAWQRLGGPSCCAHPTTDFKDTATYLDALDQAQADGLLEDWNDFLELLDGQFTEGDPPSEGLHLEILTMHGAKGLEWDLVVLPALNRKPGGVDHELLHWLPFTAAGTGKNAEQVLLAPLRSADEKDNSALVKLIRNEQKTRDAYENERLLYVATTRARERLVLSTCLEENSKGEIRPTTGSLLAVLWPSTKEDFLVALAENSAVATSDSGEEETPTGPLPDQSLRRVSADWQPPIESRLIWKPALPLRDRAIDIEFNWAGIDARRTGTVLHRLLEYAGALGIENLDSTLRHRLIQRIPKLLRATGIRESAVDANASSIRMGFERTLDDDTGRWLLSSRHTDATCELPISGLINDRLVNAVVDRTFIDEDGVRWIIDYKSGYHAGADLDLFFTQEGDRYRAQLGLYRRLFEQLDEPTGKHEIRTALYLPRHGHLEIVDTLSSTGGVLSSGEQE